MNLFSVFATIGLEDKGFEKGLSSAAEQGRDFGLTMDSVADGIVAAFTGMGAAMIDALTDNVSQIEDAAIQFVEAFTGGMNGSTAQKATKSAASQFLEKLGVALASKATYDLMKVGGGKIVDGLAKRLTGETAMAKLTDAGSKVIGFFSGAVTACKEKLVYAGGKVTEFFSYGITKGKEAIKYVGGRVTEFFSYGVTKGKQAITYVGGKVVGFFTTGIVYGKRQ